MFDEIDYVLEGRNAERFARLYSHGEFLIFIQFLIFATC
jgi:predicted unusual protein kinase regulating ubiquinone biosynthesis (AarF/ABC1/UbiB family)